MEPEFPYDLQELKQIERLIEKVPIYERKIQELSEKIQYFAEQANMAGAFSDIQEIDKLITKAFFIECENRPFNEVDSVVLSRLKAENVWHGEIKNRNLPCEICGENRSTDKCHIVPSRDGGTAESNNLLILCPTHHRLFDKFMLSKAEWALLDWDRKSEVSRKYAYSVTLEAHKRFWEKLESGGEPQAIRQYEVDKKAFLRCVTRKLGELFIPGRPVKRSSIYRMLDPNIREISKKVLAELIALGYVEKVNGKRDEILLLGTSDLNVSDEHLTHIWAEIN